MELTKDREEEILRFTQELVRCPGFSGDEAKTAAAVARQMKKLEYDKVEVDRWGNVIGTIYGTITIGSGLGSAFGAWGGGLIHDWTHSYNPLIAFALVSVILGMIPFLVVPALRR